MRCIKNTVLLKSQLIWNYYKIINSIIWSRFAYKKGLK